MNKAWSSSQEEVLQAVESDPQSGLSETEAEKRLKEFGPNQLVKERRTSFWGVFKEEVTEPMILLLLAVGVVYSIWGDARDAITIFAIIVALILIEIFTEYRAKKAVAALKKLSPPTTPVLRGGQYQKVPAVEIVRGDIVPLEAGERVPADGRVIESFGVEADESPLTGESVPVPKEDRIVPGDAPLAERGNIVFAGTTITRGRGRAVVVATAMDTELGRITGLVEEAKEPKTPLQLAMKQLAGLLVWVAVFFSVLIPGIGILQGKPYKEMVLTGLSLSFATIPEELPIIVTMILGVGAFALSKRNVLIRRLRTAETLGSVTVIATDKTGTLTENRMQLARIATDAAITSFPPSSLSPAERFLLQIGALTSCIRKGSEGCYVGDPLEMALLEAAEAAGLAPEQLHSQFHLRQEFSFDNQRKMMSATFMKDGQSFVYAKGAPEVILARSSRIAQGSAEVEKTEEREMLIRRQAEAMAREAMRVLAFAYRKTGSGVDLSREEAESDLIFVGLAGLADPPRAGVAQAIKITREAGIRTIVVSGDHPVTVQRVAAEVGIDSGAKLLTGAELEQMDDQLLTARIGGVQLFARTSPEQKLRIVRLLQDSGEVVAVTGDGINDAPALKSADIGVAMGETGTEVAREVADMVLTDDSFTSIAAGVREGRKIFDNLKKGVSYYLSVKVALVLSFLVPLILDIPFPFAPIQIVLLELFMDLAASATFVAEPIERDAMSRPPPSRKEKFIDRKALVNIVLGSLSLAAAVLTSYLLTWYAGWGLLEARTVAFGTWLVGHILLALTMRSQRESLWRVGVLSNRAMLVWAAAAVAFFLLATNLPLAQAPLRLTSLSLTGWLLVVAVPLVTIFWLELRKLISHRQRQVPKTVN
jgi:Ca2+-transporting ATPase